MELCILCNSKGDKGASGGKRKKGRLSGRKLMTDDKVLLPQLRVIYLLRQVFKRTVEDQTSLEALQVLGNPVEWFDICEDCGGLVDQGIHTWRELTRLEREHRRILRRLEERVAGGMVKLDGGDSDGFPLKDDEEEEAKEMSREIWRRNFRVKLKGIVNVVLNDEIKEEPEEPETVDADCFIENNWSGQQTHDESTDAEHLTDVLIKTDTPGSPVSHEHDKSTNSGELEQSEKEEEEKDADLIKFMEYEDVNDYEYAPGKAPPKKRKLKKKKQPLSKAAKEKMAKEKPLVDDEDPEFSAQCSDYLDMDLIPYPVTFKRHLARLNRFTLEPMPKHEEGQHKNGAHQCPACGRRFRAWYFALAHIHLCHFNIPQPWKCPHCAKTFVSYKMFRIHLTAHAQGKRVNCKICKKFNCRSKRLMDSHVINHFKEPGSIYKCPECLELLPTFKTLVNHLTQQHGYTPKQNHQVHICELCSKPLNGLKKLKFHKVIQHGEEDTEKLFPVCDQCGLCFFNGNTLQAHTEEKHSTSGPKWFCDQCGKEWGTEKKLRDHLKTHLKTLEICRVCGVVVGSKMRNHLVIQHKETLEMSVEQLNEYKRKKEEECKWKCLYCPERFAFRVQRYHHERQSHPEVTDKWKCAECGKGFSRGSSLKRHQETSHLGIKVNCEFCGKEFGSHNLYQHQYKGHCTEMKKRGTKGEQDSLEETVEVNHSNVQLLTL